MDFPTRIDGSDHRWFAERAPACTLLVYVDDATSRLMMPHFMQADVEHVIVDLAQRRQTAKPSDKPGRRSAKAGETTVSALPVQAPTFDTA
ncbi:hypothetical protein [Burkholderia lata]|uniref:hypothetical protein n=1 Tax=Burkholderia lata (strain ATCC 17760 / DSM 23089 / LMG 22485 / NCIMB 9086 / R18194 / 383) TaxID=482957 RepID=UPI0020C614A5|nr:hypothetical protein [Burkholderia lata]